MDWNGVGTKILTFLQNFFAKDASKNAIKPSQKAGDYSHQEQTITNVNNLNEVKNGGSNNNNINNINNNINNN